MPRHHGSDKNLFLNLKGNIKFPLDVGRCKVIHNLRWSVWMDFSWRKEVVQSLHFCSVRGRTPEGIFTCDLGIGIEKVTRTNEEHEWVVYRMKGLKIYTIVNKIRSSLMNLLLLLQTFWGTHLTRLDDETQISANFAIGKNLEWKDDEGRRRRLANRINKLSKNLKFKTLLKA